MHVGANEMTKSTISTIVLSDEEEYIEKLKDVCIEFRQRKGVPYMVLVESGLDAFEKAGKLVSGCLSDKNNMDAIDTYAIEACLEALKKESFIKEFIDSYFNLEEIYYKGMGDDELPFDNGCDEKVLRLLRPNEEDIFLCEFGFDVYQFPEAYRFLAYQIAYLKYYYSEDILKEGEIGLVYDWNEVDFTMTLLQCRNQEVEIFWRERIPDINVMLEEAVRSKMREIMLQEQEVLEILKLDETNEDVWKRFYEDTDFIIEQLRNEQSTQVRLESYLASVTNDFPQEEFDEILEKMYLETQSLIVNSLQRAGFQVEDIAKLYLSGKWSENRLVQTKIYEFLLHI